MNYYFITGTSRGIGKALAELLLQKNDNFVFGISRGSIINNKNYFHYKLDLSDLNATMKFEFPDLEDHNTISLINNSAVIGEITHVGKESSDNIMLTYNTDITSPHILINNFLKKFQSAECRRIIMNISSGAAIKPIESWGSYCASKAALAMLSEVIDLEQKLNYPSNPVHVFSVAPGVVDTAAQDLIRSTSPENFSGVKRFIEFKQKDELAHPEDVANKLIQVLDSPRSFDTVALNVRKF